MSSITNLAEKIKTAHPEYDDLDDLHLVQQIIAKYPQYSDMLDEGDKNALTNLAELNEQGPINELHGAGAPIRAGISGLADINNPQQAAENVSKVMNNEEPTTTAGKIGEFIGEQASPENIVLQGTMQELLEASGIGKALADKFSGWAQNYALNAIKFIKSMANDTTLGGLSDVADFVMNPVKIGKQTFPAIVTSSSDDTAMLKAAQTIQGAAAQVLGKVSQAGDAALDANPGLIDLKSISDDLFELKEQVEKNAPTLGAPVVAQYEKAIADFQNVLENWKSDETSALFTGLRNFKSTIGSLMGEGESVVPSKSALRRVYGVLANELDSAASKISPTLGSMYSDANKAYTFATDAVEALTNKIKGAEVAQMPTSLSSIGKAIVNTPLLSPQRLAGITSEAARFISPALKAGLGIATGGASGLVSGLTDNQ